MFSFLRRAYTHPEPEPVGVRHLFVVHTTEPVFEIGLRYGAQWMPEFLFRDGNRKAYGRAFNYALVFVPHISPRLIAVGIAPICEAIQPAFSTFIITTSCKKRSQSPDGTREAFKLCSCFVEVCSSVSKMDSHSSRVQEMCVPPTN